MRRDRILIIYLLLITAIHYAMMSTQKLVLFFAYSLGLIILTAGKMERTINSIFFIIPLENYFKYTEGSLSFVTVALVVIFILASLTYIKAFRINNLLFTLAALVVIVFRLIVIGTDSILILFRLIVNFNLVLLFANYSKDRLIKALKDGSDYYILGCVVLCAVTLLRFINTYGTSQLLARRMYGFNGDDPNFMASYICIALTLVIVKKIDIERNYRYMILVMAFVAVGIFTQSRGFILGIIPATIYIVALLVKNIRRTSVILTILVAAFIAFYLKDEIYRMTGALLVRFRTDDELSSGRFLIWSRYIHYMINNPKDILWGNIHLYNDYHRAHNLFFGALTEEGLLMTLVEIVYYGYIYRQVLFGKLTKYTFVSLLCILIVYQFINATMLNVFFYSIFTSLSYKYITTYSEGSTYV